MNYTELKERVANQLVSSELIPFIPTAIELAEARLNRDPRLQVRDRLASDAIATVASTATVALPADFSGARSVWLVYAGVTRALEFLPVDRLKADKLRVQTPGQPMYYTIIGSNMELLPVPSEAYSGELLYYQQIPALTGQAPTNWLLTKHPDLYFYGALIQASPYIHQEGRLKTWNEMYELGLEELRIQNEREEFPGGPLKTRPRGHSG